MNDIIRYRYDESEDDEDDEIYCMNNEMLLHIHYLSMSRYCKCVSIYLRIYLSKYVHVYTFLSLY